MRKIDLEKIYPTASPYETKKIAAQISGRLKPGDVIFLSGELGSGKTTFIQGLLAGLGVRERVVSPTFSILRKYQINSKKQKRIKHVGSKNSEIRVFYHIDLYRMESKKDLDNLGLSEILNNRQAVTAVEWPERISSAMKNKAKLEIKIKDKGKNKREIILNRKGNFIKNDQEILQAVKVLNSGGIVIFPTDTAFGIGCRLDNKKAVKEIFALRKRPFTQPVSILASSVEMLKPYLKDISKDIYDLMERYWPGALTLVLPCNKKKVPEALRAGGATVGVRVPDQPKLLKIIAGVGVPILGPSANLHGEKTPFSSSDLDQNLKNKVDLVISGKSKLNQVSTVLDCSKKPWTILRAGAVKL